MLEQEGHVVGLEGDDALVQVARTSSCGSCESKGGCGTGALSSLFSDRAITLKVANSLGVRAGDRVVLGISEGALVKGSMMVYLLPLVGLLLGAGFGQMMAGQMLLDPDLMAAVGGLGGLALVFALMHRRQGRLRARGEFSAVLLKRIELNPGWQPVRFD